MLLHALCYIVSIVMAIFKLMGLEPLASASWWLITAPVWGVWLWSLFWLLIFYGVVLRAVKRSGLRTPSRKFRRR